MSKQRSNLQHSLSVMSTLSFHTILQFHYRTQLIFHLQHCLSDEHLTFSLILSTAFPASSLKSAIATLTPFQ